MFKRPSLANIAALMIMGFTGFLMFQMFYPFRVLEIYNNPLPTTKAVFEPGENITYAVEFCRFQGGSTSIIRKLVYDDQNTVRPLAEVKSPNDASARCPSTTNVIGPELPTNAPCGVAHLDIRYVDRVNLVQVKELAVRTQSFTICANGGQ